MDGSYFGNGKINNQCNCTNFCSKDHTLCDFPWPAKNYSCSFCKREFKSAQALGGHMNVHRRDRARLRLLPSWLAENPNPNPNLSSSPPPPLSSVKYRPSTNLFSSVYRSNNSLSSPSLTYLSSPSSASTDEEKKSVASSSGHKPSCSQDRCFGFDIRKEDECNGEKLKEKNSIVNLELKMGLFQGSNEDLDLELRL